MKFLRNLFEKIEPNFEEGGRFETWRPLFEMPYTILFTTGEVTRTASHVRDGLDLKRLMITVVIALLPCMIAGCWNIGYQGMLAMVQGAVPLDGWQTAVWEALGLEYDFRSSFHCVVFGALYFVPIYAVTMAAGGIAELIFAIVRKHEINEGFLVTSALIPLVCPPNIPLWMVALGTIFGVVLGKEVFGGVGMNFLNPALTARAFLFFAYPAFMSGDAPWIAADFTAVDNFSGATLLGQAAAAKGALADASWSAAFWGRIPGSVGETSTLACLLGAAILLITRIASYRTMGGVLAGTIFMAVVFNVSGSATNPMFAVPWYWHVVLGGWAFGTVFMATDPVSSSFTNGGKWVYGFMIGLLCILIRVFNPAYPEGMMLAILFMNMFAPLIDHFIVQANIKRRLARSAAA
ncbi:MAG: NADH:ubiquinone reductase (Na(+)-transporting) subunit B [Deltaproteobacteria bacterium]|nr:NADH:ubiquinone reductase (Na(+)-transporting) subunit B [Deltaproteobacteria bacterium]